MKEKIHRFPFKCRVIMCTKQINKYHLSISLEIKEFDLELVNKLYDIHSTCIHIYISSIINKIH